MGLGFLGVRIREIGLTSALFLTVWLFVFKIWLILIYSCILIFVTGHLLPFGDQKDARNMVDIFVLMDMTMGRTGLGRLKIQWTGRVFNRTGVDMGGLGIVLSESGWMSFPKPQ